MNQVKDNFAAESSQIAKFHLGTIGISVLIHIAALLLLGGMVLVEYDIPRTHFVDELASEGEPSVDQPMMPEDSLEMPPTADVMSSPSETSSSSEVPNAMGDVRDLITVESSNSLFSVVTVPQPSINMNPSLSRGLGAGSGTAKSSGGTAGPLGKQSTFSFLGIKSDSRRVVFLMDTSGSMILEAKGGGRAMRP